MAENVGFTHLPLPLLFQGKPKLHGGGAVSAQTKQNTTNRVSHGDYIKRQSAELSRFWKERKVNRIENNLPEIETGIPILLEIDPSSNIDFLRGLGFEIVCEIEEGFIIVATDDVDLSILNEKVDDFIANIKAKCNSPAKVYALCEDNDRLKKILSPELYSKWVTIAADTVYLVDIGVSCCGDIELPKRPQRDENETDEHYRIREQHWREKFNAAYIAWDEIKMQREETIESFVVDYSGEIMQFADGSSNIVDLPDSFSARLKISGKCLRDLVLNFAYIFEVAESERINMGSSAVNDSEMAEDVTIEPPEKSSPIVCVIDSGIQEEHKYLAPAIISGESISLIPSEGDTSDRVLPGGHGTRVAGAILYPQEIPIHGSYINQDVPIYEPIRSMIEVEANVENNEIEVEMPDINTSPIDGLTDAAMNNPQTDAADLVIRMESYRQLYTAIGQLPETQRRRLLLHFANNLTYRQIAKLEEVDRGAVGRSIKRALIQLQKYLTD